MTNTSLSDEAKNASNVSVERAGEAPDLGLFAVFYDGETRPVAGFVLEQDAERYAKEHSGGEVSYEIRRVHVVDWNTRADSAALRERIADRMKQQCVNKVRDLLAGSQIGALRDIIIAELETVELDPSL